METQSPDLLRRRLTLCAAASLLQLPLIASAHNDAGLVQPPVAMPPLKVALLTGKTTDLPTLLRGRVTAVQLMFTGCSATCPIQGAIFAEMQTLLKDAGADLQLLSVSIDPLGDDVRSMQKWLAQFGAMASRWSAAMSTMQSVDGLFDFMNGRASGPDRHTPQVYLFDRSARLVFRSVDLPPAQPMVRLMRELAALKP